MTKPDTIKRTYVVTREIDRKLETLARVARRNKSAQLCALIEQAYKRMEQARPSE